MDKLISELSDEELGKAVTRALLDDGIEYLDQNGFDVVVDGTYIEANIGKHLKRVLLTPPPAPAEESTEP